MGGLASGIYGQLNGYRIRIFEFNAVPGGQCASWKRKGYTFDGCIHHLFSCAPGSPIYRLWSELGAMPRERVKTRGCVTVASPEGKPFNDNYDPDLLEQHLKELSPGDVGVIEQYVRAISAFGAPISCARPSSALRQGLCGLPRARELLYGAWATEAGALFSNALSGRKAIAHLCKHGGKAFRAA